jgi:hypothetical protein
MWHNVDLGRTDDSKESVPSIIKVEKINELVTTLAVSSKIISLIVTDNVVPGLLVPSTL